MKSKEKRKSIVKSANNISEAVHYLNHDVYNSYQAPANILEFGVEYSLSLTDSGIKDFIFQRHFMHEIKLEDGRYLIPRKHMTNINDNDNQNPNLRKNEQTESRSSIADSDNGLHSQLSNVSLRSKSNTQKSSSALLASFSASAKQKKEEKDFIDSFFQYNKDAHRIVPARPLHRPSARKDFQHRILTLQEGFQDMSIISSDTHTTTMVIPQFVIDEKKREEAEAAAAAAKAATQSDSAALESTQTGDENDDNGDNDENDDNDHQLKVSPETADATLNKDNKEGTNHVAPTSHTTSTTATATRLLTPATTAIAPAAKTTATAVTSNNKQSEVVSNTQ